jgi:hypothetical protein
MPINPVFKKVWRVIAVVFIDVLIWSVFCRVLQGLLRLSSDTIAPIWGCGIGVFVLVLIVQIARGKFKYDA